MPVATTPMPTAAAVAAAAVTAKINAMDLAVQVFLCRLVPHFWVFKVTVKFLWRVYYDTYTSDNDIKIAILSRTPYFGGIPFTAA